LPAAHYSLIVVVIAAFALVFPVPEKQVRDSALAAIRSSSEIAVLGPSVVRHTSVCDRDARKMPRMLADASDRSVVDLSYPGQPITAALYVAALEAAYGRATDIVVLTTYDGFVEWPTLPYREMIFFRLLNGSFGAPIDFGWSGAWDGLLDRPTPVEQGFAYDGVVYPDARGIHAKWFEAEKARQTCPETITHDWRYLRAYTWFRGVQADPHPAMLPLMARLNDYARKRGKSLHVVMLPVNYGLLAGFNPDWATKIEERELRRRDDLRRLGISVLDLTLLLSADQFSTVWCACTHFNESGRRKVVEAISRHLSAPRQAIGAILAEDDAVNERAPRPN
jgi:hypothetical protein